MRCFSRFLRPAFLSDSWYSFLQEREKEIKMEEIGKTVIRQDFQPFPNDFRIRKNGTEKARVPTMRGVENVLETSWYASGPDQDHPAET
jgi:DNA modification methylase